MLEDQVEDIDERLLCALAGDLRLSMFSKRILIPVDIRSVLSVGFAVCGSSSLAFGAKGPPRQATETSRRSSGGSQRPVDD
jgi:hypothetical protein